MSSRAVSGRRRFLGSAYVETRFDLMRLSRTCSHGRVSRQGQQSKKDMGAKGALVRTAVRSREQFVRVCIRQNMPHTTTTMKEWSKTGMLMVVMWRKRERGGI